MTFEITTNKQTANKVEQVVESNKRLNIDVSFIIEKIEHFEGYSIIKFAAKNGLNVEVKDIFFLGLYTGLRK